MMKKGNIMKCVKTTRSLLLALSLTMVTNSTNTMESTDASWMTTGIALIGNILLAKISLSALWEQPNAFPFSELPKELQNNIIKLIIAGTTSKTLEDAASAINALAQVNQEFNALINDPQFSRELIEKLSQEFTNGDALQVCNALQTKGAFNYMASYHDNLFGFTPLIEMLRKPPNYIRDNYNRLLRLISSSGQYIDLKNNYGLSRQTALITALVNAQSYIRSTQPENTPEKQKEAIELYREIIQLLLNHGADPELADDKGITPLEAAIELDDIKIVQMIHNAINKKYGI